MPLPLSRLPTSWWRSIRLAGACSAAAVTILVIAGGVASGYAEAKDDPACEQFDWSIKRELALFANPNLEMVFSGATLNSLPEKGLVIELQPHGTMDYVLAPAHEPKSEDTFAGLILVANVPQTGAYQVTLSQDAWIDLIQDGKAQALSAETISTDCGDARKSMRFHLEQGSLTVQVSGAASNQIRLAIFPVE